MAKKLKILSVGSLGKRKELSPFRKDHAESLIKLGVDVDYFDIKGHGIKGYLKYYFKFRKKIFHNSYDIIHGHYGLSGILCVMQKKVPVVVTFHGSDIWQSKIKIISLIASYLSSWNIFISKTQRDHALFFRKTKSSVIPCGVNLNVFFPIEKSIARKRTGFKDNNIHILFSSSFKNKIKNYQLAKNALDYLPKVKLHELSGYEKPYVNYLMNACDALLVTSLKESGPLVVKEAMGCNLPVVSTDVGDVSEVIKGTSGCYLTSYSINDVVKNLRMAINFKGRTNGRKKIQQLSLENIAKAHVMIYRQILIEKYK